MRREQEAATQDAWFATVRARCTDQSVDFALRNNVVCKLINDYYAPVIPPSCTDLKQLICMELHASGLGGHLGFDKMYRECKKRFYWKNMRVDLHRFCKECTICQQNRVSTTAPAGLLQPHSVPEKPF